MKHLAYPLITCLVLTASQAFTDKYSAGNSLDVNLNGGANLNINNANNNKLTAPLKNFTPIPMPQMDLQPLSTPPVTHTVTSLYGGWKNIDTVDPGYSDAEEAKAIHKREGLYRGHLPQGIPDDQPVRAEDISNFLDGYHTYLKDVGLESGYTPTNVSQPPIEKGDRAKKSSQLPMQKSNAVELLASQQKLLLDTNNSGITPTNH